MSEARTAVLPDRGVVSVTGEDAAKLLAGIITNEMAVLQAQPAIFAGLLSPQGKILFDFLVVKSDDGYRLDVARDKAADLAKRLAMYKLRAKAQIADISAAHGVQVMWGGRPAAHGGDAYPDPRLPAIGHRAIIPAVLAAADGNASNPTRATAADYHAHRIALGVPEGGKDYDFGDVYPHEANFDRLHGVSFDKGCYVGQEIVARMQHKTVARKRVVGVAGTQDLPTQRPEITVDDVVIGRLGSVSGRRGLAMLRLDRVIEARAKGQAIICDGGVLSVDETVIDGYRATVQASGARGGPA